MVGSGAALAGFQGCADIGKTRRIVFHPSARLRDELKRVKFETVVADDDDSDGGDGE